MNKNVTKQIIIIITYAVFLVLLVINFKGIMRFVGEFMRLISPLFIGVAIAFVLDGPYKSLRKIFNEKCKMKLGMAKGLAITFVYVGTFGIIALLIRFIVPQISSNIQTFTGNVNVYIADVQKLINKGLTFLGMETIKMQDIMEFVNSKIDKIGSAVAGAVPTLINVTSSVFSAVTTAVISIVLSIYVMAGQRRLVSQVNRTSKVYMPEKMYSKCCYVMEIVKTVFRNYVSGQMLEACILGGLCFLGMLILRLDYAALTGVIVILTALVPILGAWVGGALAVILQLFVSTEKALIFLVFFIVLQQIENNLIYPRVVGTKLGLPGIWVLIGVTVGGGLFGIVGMFVGVPIATVLFIILKNDVNKKSDIDVEEDEDKSKKNTESEKIAETEKN